MLGPPSSVAAVVCDMAGVTAITLDTGTGDDWLTVYGTPVPVTVRPGGRDDVLFASGANAAVTLIGDNGNDVFVLPGGPVAAYGCAGVHRFAPARVPARSRSPADRVSTASSGSPAIRSPPTARDRRAGRAADERPRARHRRPAARAPIGARR